MPTYVEMLVRVVVAIDDAENTKIEDHSELILNIPTVELYDDGEKRKCRLTEYETMSAGKI